MVVVVKGDGCERRQVAGTSALEREAICSVIATASHFEELHHGICILQIY